MAQRKSHPAGRVAAAPRRRGLLEGGGDCAVEVDTADIPGSADYEEWHPELAKVPAGGPTIPAAEEARGLVCPHEGPRVFPLEVAWDGDLDLCLSVDRHLVRRPGR
jgi:hypothetical protein